LDYIEFVDIYNDWLNFLFFWKLDGGHILLSTA